MSSAVQPTIVTGASDAATRDWETIRAAGDIQYAPVPPVAPPETPEWLRALGEFFGRIFGWIGKLFGMSVGTIQWIAIGLGVLLAAFLIWRIAQRLLEARRQAKPQGDPGWRPDHGAAVALLEDADRLAAEGHYGEAAHLLLQRSVHHIASARPDWLHPSSTAREIARLEPLPTKARAAFATIAERVERSLFALRPLDAADWQAARAAYADFALEQLA